MNKFAIYTACIGGYDNIVQPEVIDERFDYILFTNDVKEERIGVWQVRQVNYTNSDKTRIARYVKTHPEELLPGYEASLWLDSNIQIISPRVYERFEELYTNNVIVSALFHPLRDCIYDEAFIVSNRPTGPIEHDYISLEWCNKLWREKYPRHYGLCETGVLYRLANKESKLINELWWSSIKNYSKRDQLSFNYALYSADVDCEYFLENKEDIRHSSLFKMCNHSNLSKKNIKMGFSEFIRFKCNNLSDGTRLLAEKEWHHMYKNGSCRLLLYFIGWAKFIFLSPILIFNKIKHQLH